MPDVHFPTAKNKGIVIQEADTDLLIYDLESKKANCLNASAAIIWRHCNGKNGLSRIHTEFEKATRSKVTEEFVQFGIDELRRFKLVETSDSDVKSGPALSRRAVIKRLGLSIAVALPIVASLVAPTAAHANSNCVIGGPCTCDGALPPMVGEICPTSVPCADINCRCSWLNNGNTMGTCVA
jgi:hypothetical protein